MTGYPEYNYPAFNSAAKTLRERGHEALNPAEVKVDGEPTWEKFMRADLKLIMDADAICLLDGWEKSRGAVIEKELADKLGIPTLEL